MLAIAASITGCSRASTSSQPRVPAGYSTDAAPRATPVPPPMWSRRQRDEVTSKMSAIFTGDIAAGMGIVVVAADGSHLFARRSRVAMTPASTLKLVIAATALDSLGPKHRFETRFVGTSPPDADGVLHGGLWLVGAGDPMLDSKNVREGSRAAVSNASTVRSRSTIRPLRDPSKTRVGIPTTLPTITQRARMRSPSTAVWWSST